jgi:hypothetical protein
LLGFFVVLLLVLWLLFVFVVLFCWLGGCGWVGCLFGWGFLWVVFWCLGVGLFVFFGFVFVVK